MEAAIKQKRKPRWTDIYESMNSHQSADESARYIMALRSEGFVWTLGSILYKAEIDSSLKELEIFLTFSFVSFHFPVFTLCGVDTQCVKPCRSPCAGH